MCLPLLQALQASIRPGPVPPELLAEALGFESAAQAEAFAAGLQGQGQRA